MASRWRISELFNYYIYTITTMPSCLLTALKKKTAYERWTRGCMQPPCNQLQCKLHTGTCMQTTVLGCTSACTAHGLDVATASALHAMHIAIDQALLHPNPRINVRNTRNP